MKTTLLQLQNNINNLIDYIDYNEKVKRFIVLAKKKDTVLREEAEKINSNSTNSKVFEYNSYIISLYGFFESFLEQMIGKYILGLPSFYASYDHLPKNIQDVNVEKVTELLSKLSLPKYQELEAKIIVNTLNNNLNNGLPEVCVEAFAHHNANFRINTIGEYFKQVGMSSIVQDISNIQPMKAQLEEIHDNPAALSNEKKFNIINELAERRNHIAHGVEADELLAPNDIKIWCEYLLKFCESLYHSVESKKLLALVDEHSNTSAVNVIPIEVKDIFNKKILGFQSNNQEVKVGQEILIKRNSEPKCFLRTIKSIQLDDHKLQRCPAYINKPIGVLLESGLQKNYKYYLITYK